VVLRNKTLQQLALPYNPNFAEVYSNEKGANVIADEVASNGLAGYKNIDSTYAL
jgi:hypothetical protein